MPAIPLKTPADLVTKAGKKALFPVVDGIKSESTTEILLGYKRLLKGVKVDPSKDVAHVYDASKNVFHGELLDASTVTETALQIHEPGNSFFYNGDNELLALHIMAKATLGSFPVYYLPWGSNSTHCMKLGSQASVFITAALQGCSIFVEGLASAPTVYHLNANAVHSGTPGKIAAMNSRFKHASDVLSSHGKGRTAPWRGNPWKAATMADYMPGMLSTTATNTLEYALGMRGRTNWHVRENTFRSHWKVDQDVALQYGTVFGIRTGLNWAFYQQQRTRHEYEYKPWFSARTKHAYWKVECKKFWP